MPGLDEFSLDGKVAVVTGSGQGIGKGIALAMARAGADIVVAGISLTDRARDQEDLDITAGDIRIVGRRSVAIPTDARSGEDVDRHVVVHELAQDPDHRGGETASREALVALHEEQDLVVADEPVNLGAEGIGEGHGDLSQCVGNGFAGREP